MKNLYKVMTIVSLASTPALALPTAQQQCDASRITAENGTAFTSFLDALNGSGFASANGWRLPTMPELQTIVKDFACVGAFDFSGCECSTAPCIDPTFGLTGFTFYWTSTPYLSDATQV